MSSCKTCRYWQYSADDDYICRPLDEDTYEPKKMPFEVKECTHPGLVRFERTVEINGFCMTDGSDYKACLFTAEEFGCVRHEPIIKETQ